ncbi:hypothetical protein Hamer_G001047 [Homarus americanus]|uniref:Uncharacterized protein n=1 Tax=Homarus americanus TaxID=6706 RepID=A0A8J5N2L1_HOMAM|nr:hypothetical protein Hamer_G001047 [Homarus americanus]
MSPTYGGSRSHVRWLLVWLLMVMLDSACSLFNTSRNFQIFGWNEVMETSANVCIFEVLYDRISFRWYSLLQRLKCVNHFILVLDTVKQMGTHIQHEIPHLTGHYCTSIEDTYVYNESTTGRKMHDRAKKHGTRTLMDKVAEAPKDKTIVVAGGFNQKETVVSYSQDVDTRQLEAMPEEPDTCRLILHCMQITTGTVLVHARRSDLFYQCYEEID